MIDQEKIVRIIEAALFTAESPMEAKDLANLFNAEELAKETASKTIRDALRIIEKECSSKSIELKRVASGYRFQVKKSYSEWIGRMLPDRPPRYTRALMETLAIIVYKQPVTRGDIEELRGVSVGQNIMRTLLERGWIRTVGQKEVPGRPALYASTKEFLDYFDLKNLNELPEFSEIQELVEKGMQDKHINVVGQLALNKDQDGALRGAEEDDQSTSKFSEDGDGSSNVVNLPLNS